ncbi:MAG: VCBS repeat-containing protein [Planctomycetota bacterium]
MHKLSILSIALPLAAGASAQQFVYQPGMIPGPAVWTEGVQAVDVDLDGDPDLCFANGDGFTSAGTQRQCGLIINQRVETGSLSFTDESVARLGTWIANGKGFTAGDVNGDGYPDLLYCNAFNTDPPFLFINRGAAQPGYFDMESTTRGFTESLSSAGAQFGDLDNDGDLDVILCDCGNNFLGTPGGQPRLFFNDGTGHFSEDAAAMNAPVKSAHMDVQLVDLDGDWTVDFFGANRSTNAGGTHYVMLNDGTGHFTDVSGLLPATSGSVYEAEVGDLDGDTDVDMFFVSLTGFQEGPISNLLVQNGSLGFQVGTPETGSIDDNEVVLLDYDNDGDFDPFIGSLGSTERAYRNDGAMNFTPVTIIQAVADSTLDMTAADLDLDGAYDLITAQGESNAAQYANKVYLNTGSPDTLAPVLVDSHLPTLSTGWPVVVQVKYRDQVLDDGVDYVSSIAYAAPMLGIVGSVDVNAGGFTPSSATVAVGESLQFSAVLSPATVTLQGPVDFAFSLAAGGVQEWVFVRPGVYTVTSSLSSNSLTVTVTGTETSVKGLPMGIGQHRYGIPQLPLTPLDTMAVWVALTDAPGNTSWHPLAPVDYPGGGVVRYCSPAVVNTTNQSAIIDWTGSFAIADQNFGLTASQLPLNEFGFFLVATGQAMIPNAGGSFGTLCLGTNIGRFNQVSQIGNSGSSGSIALSVPLGSLPLNPAQAAQAGSTYHFQAWYRDSVFTTSNFTDAISVTFE